jgi:hypothetical protein
VGSHGVPRRRDEGAIREAGDRLGGAAAEALVEVVAKQGEQLEAESTGDPGRARVFGEIGARVEEVRVAGDEAEGLVVGLLREGLHGVGEELAGEGGPWEATASSSGPPRRTRIVRLSSHRQQESAPVQANRCIRSRFVLRRGSLGQWISDLLRRWSRLRDDRLRRGSGFALEREDLRIDHDVTACRA